MNHPTDVTAGLENQFMKGTLSKSLKQDRLSSPGEILRAAPQKGAYHMNEAIPDVNLLSMLQACTETLRLKVQRLLCRSRW